MRDGAVRKTRRHQTAPVGPHLLCRALRPTTKVTAGRAGLCTQWKQGPLFSLGAQLFRGAGHGLSCPQVGTSLCQNTVFRFLRTCFVRTTCPMPFVPLRASPRLNHSLKGAIDEVQPRRLPLASFASPVPTTKKVKPGALVRDQIASTINTYRGTNGRVSAAGWEQVIRTCNTQIS